MANPLLFPWCQLPSDVCESIELTGSIKEETDQIIRTSENEYTTQYVFEELKLKRQVALSTSLASDILCGKVKVFDSHELPTTVPDGQGIPIDDRRPMITEKIGNEWLASKNLPLKWEPSKTTVPPITVLPKAKIIDLTKQYWPSAEKKFNQASVNGLDKARVKRGKFDLDLTIQIATENGWLDSVKQDDMESLIREALHPRKK